VRKLQDQGAPVEASGAMEGGTVTNDAPPSHLVVVGSSAGGIDALSRLVSGLPKSFPAPLVVAQHLDPRTASHLGEILAPTAPYR